MHCRRNSVGDQCEWPGYLPAAKHQIDSRVSSAPASAPAYLQRRPLHAAAGLPPPWPCSGPAAVLPGNPSGLEPDQLNGWYFVITPGAPPAG
jgi:hypothetical protein